MSASDDPATSRFADLTLSAVSMGVLVALIGFTSSFAIVLAGLRESGANEAQAASGLMALLIGCGAAGVWLSATRRMPLSCAWSLPGAALLISSGSTIESFEQAVGAFLASSVLLMIAGLVRPVGRAIEAIPGSLANAMLAGILLTLCFAPVRALAFDAWLVAPLLLTWWLVGLWQRLFAVPAALLVLVPLVIWRVDIPADLSDQLLSAAMPSPVLVIPQFDLQTIIGIGVPLFVVTMASQNVPGIAIQRANGYRTPSGPMVVVTAFFSLLAAPFGAHAVNLAAITAALCAGEDAHPNPSLRYWAAIIAGLGYIVLGLFAGVVVLLVTLVPPIVVEAIAGLALLGSFTVAALAAFADPQEREAAAVTFLFSGSGLAFFGVGAAFWGLIIGGVMLAVTRYARRRAPTAAEGASPTQQAPAPDGVGADNA